MGVRQSAPGLRPALRLVAIAGPPCLDVGSIVDACRAAEAGGATAVQLRLKLEPVSVLFEVTRELVKRLTIPVWVNDRADVALAAGAAGVHVGAEDIPPNAVLSISPASFLVGTSVGDKAEAVYALGQTADYWSIGSIYATGSKADAGSPIGTRGFKELRARAPEGMPVIGIGGINCENAAEVIRSGADGIAVISAVFGDTNTEQAARDLRGIVDETLGV
jgi:thiamine-phosphate pyrophosphorylase